jgi:1-acyl-sn-glycerol-3-phosphate acyltransferase
VPVAIQGSRDVLPRTSQLTRPGSIRITYGEPIDISGFQLTEKARLSRQVRETILTMMGQ